MIGAKFKGLALKLTLFLVVFGGGLLIVEVGVRVLYKDKTVLFPRYHTEAHYGDYTLRKIRPESVFWHASPDGAWKFEINKQGLRNSKDLDYEKAEGVTRVLCLGDSHTQGYEVRQDFTYSAIIEKSLNQRGRRAEVINAGVSGFSTAEELLYLENEGIKYSPDFVVVGFYANDYQDNLKANFFKLGSNRELEIQKKSHIPGVKIQNFIYALPFTKWLSEHSYFYSLLFNNTWNYFKKRLAKSATESLEEYAIPTQEEHSEYESALAGALLQRMHAFCQKEGIGLILLDIPRLGEEANHDLIRSSFTESTASRLSELCDDFILSKSVLKDYIGVTDLHVQHGQKHISEFTHTLLGVAVADKIMESNSADLE